MEIRHKRHGRSISKNWGSVTEIINSKELSGRLLNLNENQSTSFHFHAEKFKTIYVLYGSLTIEIIDKENADRLKYVIDSEECFDVDPNIVHRLYPTEGSEGSVTAIEVSTHHSDNDVYRVEIFN